MGLPWARLDTNMPSHDKILALVERRNGKSAGFVYLCSIAHCAGQGTDGLVTFAAIRVIHGTKRDAEMLVDVGLWEPAPRGWLLHNYGDRQQLTFVSDAIRAAQRHGALRANCVRWHGVDCKCWVDAK